MATLDRDSLFSVAGLVAVVTGGGTGIGLMMAKALEKNGATVYIVGRRFDVLEKAAKENSTYGKIIPLQGDVSSKESLLSVVSAIKARTGYINLLVNNSGIMGNTIQDLPNAYPGSGKSVKELQEYLWNSESVEEFVNVFKVNLGGVWFGTIAFLQLLEEGNKPGRGVAGVTSQVITISSIEGFRRDSKPLTVPYNLSKIAATQLGKTLSNILVDYDIRSNVIAPGLYPSEMSDGVIDAQTATVPKEIVPMRRPGTELDMGGLILYLASRAGAYSSGSVYLSDGARLGLFPNSY
ncbi:NAD-binding protein [Sistotremastrum niveocremeum HHB9708]|uniref:NAD-binding protein n=1 Tax=Sistotremastrum niveocremeum HHB9708 TaxID=1314777 RepID=A0A164V471_9AGAM|nr:NAD-binding protein [Sistotremastrum niveocremeum HHB9708]